MNAMGATLLWFRQDLRLSDNPALAAALERGGPIIPVFIWAPEEEGAWAPGAASRWWLHQSLTSLGQELEKRGSRLVIRRGPTIQALRELAVGTGATTVHWNRRYEPAAIARDAAVKSSLRESGLAAESFNGNLLFEPWTIRNTNGEAFRMFTPFWRACQKQRIPPPGGARRRKRLPAPQAWPYSLPLSELGLEPAIDWASRFSRDLAARRSGRKGALTALCLKTISGIYGAARPAGDLWNLAAISPFTLRGNKSRRSLARGRDAHQR